MQKDTRRGRTPTIMSQALSKRPTAENYGRYCYEQSAFLFKIRTQIIDLWSHFGFENGSKSMQQIVARKVDMMMPQCIQNDEQMNLKRMQHICISWQGDCIKNMFLGMFFSSC